jgi:hypothetical protein
MITIDDFSEYIKDNIRRVVKEKIKKEIKDIKTKEDVEKLLLKEKEPDKDIVSYFVTLYEMGLGIGIRDGKSDLEAKFNKKNDEDKRKKENPFLRRAEREKERGELYGEINKDEVYAKRGVFKNVYVDTYLGQSSKYAKTIPERIKASVYREFRQYFIEIKPNRKIEIKKQEIINNLYIGTELDPQVEKILLDPEIEEWIGDAKGRAGQIADTLFGKKMTKGESIKKLDNLFAVDKREKPPNIVEKAKEVRRLRKIYERDHYLSQVVDTEVGLAYSLGRLKIYQERGIKFVRWNFDRENFIQNKVCPVCIERSNSGYGYTNIFKIDDILKNPEFQVPIHPFCLCYFTPEKDQDVLGKIKGIWGRNGFEISKSEEDVQRLVEEDVRPKGSLIPGYNRLEQIKSVGYPALAAIATVGVLYAALRGNIKQINVDNNVIKILGNFYGVNEINAIKNKLLDSVTDVSVEKIGIERSLVDYSNAGLEEKRKEINKDKNEKLKEIELNIKKIRAQLKLQQQEILKELQKLDLQINKLKQRLNLEKRGRNDSKVKIELTNQIIELEETTEGLKTEASILIDEGEEKIRKYEERKIEISKEREEGLIPINLEIENRQNQVIQILLGLKDPRKNTEDFIVGEIYKAAETVKALRKSAPLNQELENNIEIDIDKNFPKAIKEYKEKNVDPIIALHKIDDLDLKSAYEKASKFVKENQTPAIYNQLKVTENDLNNLNIDYDQFNSKLKSIQREINLRGYSFNINIQSILSSKSPQTYEEWIDFLDESQKILFKKLKNSEYNYDFYETLEDIRKLILVANLIKQQFRNQALKIFQQSARKVSEGLKTRIISELSGKEKYIDIIEKRLLNAINEGRIKQKKFHKVIEGFTNIEAEKVFRERIKPKNNEYLKKIKEIETLIEKSKKINRNLSKVSPRQVSKIITTIGGVLENKTIKNLINLQDREISLFFLRNKDNLLYKEAYNHIELATKYGELKKELENLIASRSILDEKKTSVNIASILLGLDKKFTVDDIRGISRKLQSRKMINWYIQERKKSSRNLTENYLEKEYRELIDLIKERGYQMDLAFGKLKIDRLKKILMRALE